MLRAGLSVLGPAVVLFFWVQYIREDPEIAQSMLVSAVKRTAVAQQRGGWNVYSTQQTLHMTTSSSSVTIYKALRNGSDPHLPQPAVVSCLKSLQQRQLVLYLSRCMGVAICLTLSEFQPFSSELMKDVEIETKLVFVSKTVFDTDTSFFNFHILHQFS